MSDVPCTRNWPATGRSTLLPVAWSRVPVGWAMLASAVVFGCVHLPDFKFAWYPVPALVLLGLAAAWLLAVLAWF